MIFFCQAALVSERHFFFWLLHSCIIFRTFNTHCSRLDKPGVWCQEKVCRPASNTSAKFNIYLSDLFLVTNIWLKKVCGAFIYLFFSFWRYIIASQLLFASKFMLYYLVLMLVPNIGICTQWDFVLLKESTSQLKNLFRDNFSETLITFQRTFALKI